MIKAELDRNMIINSTKQSVKRLVELAFYKYEATDEEMNDLLERMKVNIYKLSLEELLKFRDYINRIIDCRTRFLESESYRVEYYDFIRKYYGMDEYYNRLLEAKERILGGKND